MPYYKICCFRWSYPHKYLSEENVKCLYSAKITDNMVIKRLYTFLNIAFCWSFVTFPPAFACIFTKQYQQLTWSMIHFEDMQIKVYGTKCNLI